MTNWNGKLVRTIALCLTVIFHTISIPAVIFLNHGSTEHNTSPPDGEFTGSGWELHGFFNAFTGIPVHKHGFITAKHIGGQIGTTFRFQNVVYKTVAYYPDPDSDLIIWQVDKPISNLAVIADRLPLIDTQVVVFGRGTRRGNPIFIDSNLEEPIGWKWGKADHILRWGTNRISAIRNSSNRNVRHDSINASNFTCRFDNFFNPHECALSTGDSGGGVFSKFGNQWKLIGINWAVTGPYRMSLDTTPFHASVHDGSPLYIFQNNRWIRNNRGQDTNPSQFIVTSVPNRIQWIDRVIELIETGKSPIEVYAADFINNEFSLVNDINVDWNQGTLSIPAMDETKFFQFKNELGYQIHDIQYNQTNFSISFR